MALVSKKLNKHTMTESNYYRKNVDKYLENYYFVLLRNR